MAAGVVPQSSCSLSPMAPARTWSTRPWGADELPLPVNPKLSGMSSVACNIMRMCVLPGVHVVALVPVFGPVPPPIRVVMPEERPWRDDAIVTAPCEYKDKRVSTAAHVTNLVTDLRTDEVNVRIDGTGGEDVALTRQRLSRYTDNHTGCHALHHVRIAGLTNPCDQTVLDADVGLQIGI
ncbi:hypothetical protein BC937DRAFT_95560 [Endogone sp. FLAS-F59071]|nr:hypothetical protein BC937DRAFT_95560 [Endogone sp. FLAS-F59071]|eukprot:RUS13289.1 hypothetical protein BC937DRAFT_95560 [Endogone sp. FLAS-F59071]